MSMRSFLLYKVIWLNIFVNELFVGDLIFKLFLANLFLYKYYYSQSNSSKYCYTSLTFNYCLSAGAVEYTDCFSAER